MIREAHIKNAYGFVRRLIKVLDCDQLIAFVLFTFKSQKQNKFGLQK